MDLRFGHDCAITHDVKIATLPTASTGTAAPIPTAPVPSDLQSTFAATLSGKIAEGAGREPGKTDKPSADSGKKKIDPFHKRDEAVVVPAVDRGSAIAASQPPLLQIVPSSSAAYSPNDGDALVIPPVDESSSGLHDQMVSLAATGAVSLPSAGPTDETSMLAANVSVTDATKTSEREPSLPLVGTTAKAVALQDQASQRGVLVSPAAASTPPAFSASGASAPRFNTGHVALPPKPATPVDRSATIGSQSVSAPQSETGSVTTMRVADRVSNGIAPQPIAQGLDTGRTDAHQQAKLQPASDIPATVVQSDAAVVVVKGGNAIQTLPPPTSTTVTNSSTNAGPGDRNFTSAVDGIGNGPVSASRASGTGELNPTGRVTRSKAFGSDLRFAKEDALGDGGDALSNLKAVVGSPHISPGSPAADGTNGGSVSNAVGAGAAQLAAHSGDAPATNVPQTAQPQSSDAARPSATPSLPQHAASHQADPASAMSNAQLIQSAHGSEMRLGMKSAEFGDISINTSLNRQTLSAQISMEHTALGHALAAHLPAIEEKLSNAYGVQAKVELRDNGNSSSAHDSSGAPKQDRQPQGYASSTAASLAAGVIQAPTSSPYTSSAATTSRLDIRI